MDLEYDSPSRRPRLQSLKSYRASLLLAYQSFGFVYGDLSISPIYVYKNTFSGKIRLYEDDAEAGQDFCFVLFTNVTAGTRRCAS